MKKAPIQDWEQNVRVWATIIANEVYEYQGSDPKVIAKQTGMKYAMATLTDIIRSLLSHQRKEIVEEQKKTLNKIREKIWKISGKYHKPHNELKTPCPEIVLDLSDLECDVLDALKEKI